MAQDITRKCPFCNGSVADWKFLSTRETKEALIPIRWAVECLGCGALGPSKPTKVEAIDSWNG